MAISLQAPLAFVNHLIDKGMQRFDNYFTSKSSGQGRAYPQLGHVFLVGAGPGDPELLTVKAHRLITEAEVVLYDWLVDQAILNLISPHAEKVFVGKKCGRHSATQSQIGELMLEYAQRGFKVVRLKGGDPAVFARAGEECELLSRHGIPFAVVPGITAASGASAFTGIPLTDRDCAQSVSFVTAHFKDPSAEPDWQSLVHQSQGGSQTQVFYMGLGRIGMIMQRLQQFGLAGEVPVAVVDRATTQHQAVCTGTVRTIAQRVREQDFQGPALIIVGEVVNKQTQVDLALLQSAGQTYA